MIRCKEGGREGGSILLLKGREGREERVKGERINVLP